MKNKILASILSVMLFSSHFSIPVYAIANNEESIEELEESTSHLPNYNELYGEEIVDNEPQVILNTKEKSVQELSYISVFIEFPDQTTISLDDKNSLAIADKVMNSGGSQISIGNKIIPIISLKDYLNKASYGKLNLTASFFPKDINNEVKSYISSKPRSYYVKKSSTNPNGYSTTADQRTRERELINEAMAAIKDSVEASLSPESIDSGNDGIIDAISFFVESPLSSSDVAWGDLLWSHKTNGYSSTTIHGKRLDSYNLISVKDPKSPGGPFSYSESTGTLWANRASYGVIHHEYMHTLGLPDLYRGNGNGQPIGFYDLMADTSGYIPQEVLSILQRDWLRWGEAIEKVVSKKTITLERPKYARENEKTSIKVYSPLKSDEYFVIEFYEKPVDNPTLQVGRSDGLIIYRVNSNISSGNINGIADGSLDYLYVFRPGDNDKLNQGNGILTDAVVFANQGNTYGKTLDESNGLWDSNSIYFSNGENSGIKVEVKNSTPDTITFEVLLPSIMGVGSKEDPYIISKAEDFKIIEGNLDKYFKQINDIDFNGVDFKSIPNFKGNYDGNGNTIKNINISNGSGIFDSIDTNGTVSNLLIENINVFNMVEGHAGVIAGTHSGKISNVGITSGTVRGTITSWKYQGVGGLVGTAIDGSTIEHSYSSAAVLSGHNTGGLVGLNQNSKISYSYANGRVENGQTSSGALIGGEFIMSPTKFNELINCAFDVDKTGQSKGQQNRELSNVIGYKKSGDIILDLSEVNKANAPIITNGTGTNISYSTIIGDNSIATVDSNNNISAKKVGATYGEASIQVGNNVMKVRFDINVIDTKKINTLPRITTSTYITIYANESFNPLTYAAAYDAEDGDISDKVTVMYNNVNIAKVGTYGLKYEVIDSDGGRTSRTCTVEVLKRPPNSKPVIEIDENKTTIKVGDKFNPLDIVKITDAEDGVIKPKLEHVLINKVNVTKAGEYSIKYGVYDKGGAYSTISTTIKVIENTNKNL
ncbi:immunoglobulin-like domain-containing protein [Clostridium sp.]|uniref:immunoglobulin-like domain-containing protein n=1 Tax=Clostridium sp. TaxID=1506 RepID=UPI003F3F9FCF